MTVQPDPRLDPSTRYGRLWQRLVARRDRRVAQTYRLAVGTAEGERAMSLDFEALHLGLRFLARYRLGAYAQAADVMARGDEEEGREP